MKKIYYLSTCDTCKKILKRLGNLDNFELQDIKKEPLTEKQLEELHSRTGSYEELFNKRAQLYKTRNLKEQNLQEIDFKTLLLEHYTFLKRPVVLIDEHIYVGNSKKVVEELINSTKVM